MRRLVATAFALLVVLPVAAPEAATRAAVAPGLVSSGPYLAGSGVAWADDLCRGACDDRVDFFYGGTEHTLRVKLPGRRAIALQTDIIDLPSDREDGEVTEGSNTVVSGGWTATGAFKRTAVSLSVARVGVKKKQVLVRCNTSGEDDAQNATLVDRFIAYRSDPCKPAGPLTVRNLVTGESRGGLDPGGQPRTVSASRLVSLVGGGTALRTRDWRTGVQIGPDIPVPAGYDVDSADLDTDGTLAVFLYRQEPDLQCEGRIVVYPPGSGDGRQITDRACSNSPVRIDGGRAAYMLAPRDSFRVVETDAMGVTRTLVRFTGAVPGGFDADANTVAFASRRCDGRSDVLRSRRAGPTYSEGSASCPVRLPGSIRLRGRSASVVVKCRRGCRGTLGLRRGRARVASGNFAVSRSGRVRIALSKRGRARLARRSLGALTLRAVTLDRSGGKQRQRRGVALR